MNRRKKYLVVTIQGLTDRGMFWRHSEVLTSLLLNLEGREKLE